MTNDLIDQVERVLDIEFYGWQRKYLLNEPMLLDMQITGRCTGKTLVYIIKQLFESEEPLLLRNRAEVLRNADWWCCERRKDRAIGHPYLQCYKRTLIDIYERLKTAGLPVRDIIK